MAQINTSAPVGFGTMGAVVLGLSLALTEFRVGCGGVETICANRRNLRLNRCCDGGDVEVVTPFRRNFQWSRLARRGIREP